jgi:hypothetical protein
MAKSGVLDRTSVPGSSPTHKYETRLRMTTQLETSTPPNCSKIICIGQKFYDIDPLREWRVLLQTSLLCYAVIYISEGLLETDKLYIITLLFSPLTSYFSISKTIFSTTLYLQSSLFQSCKLNCFQQFNTTAY